MNLNRLEAEQRRKNMKRLYSSCGGRDEFGIKAKRPIFTVKQLTSKATFVSDRYTVNYFKNIYYFCMKFMSNTRSNIFVHVLNTYMLLMLMNGLICNYNSWWTKISNRKLISVNMQMWIRFQKRLLLFKIKHINLCEL